MTPEAFVTSWGKKGLIRFSAECVGRLRIAGNAKRFLIRAGLPKSAAPFLTFDNPGMPPFLTVPEVYTGAAVPPRYKVIGEDGGGGPICIDEDGKGTVVVLDCENGFRRTFVNSSIPRFAESLLAYRSFIAEVQRKGGDEAWLEERIPLECVASLRQALSRIDPSVLRKGFWRSRVSRHTDAARAALRTRPESPQELGDLLSRGSPKDRRHAADQHLRVRRDAALALAQIGPGAKAACPRLVRLLGDKVPAVVGHALEALGKIGKVPVGARKPLQLLSRHYLPWIKNPAKRLLKRLKR